MKLFPRFAMLSLIAACRLAAQFGGDQGDVVLLVVTHRGPANFQTAAPGATNSTALQARFKITDMAALPVELIAPGFDARTTQIGVRESDDRFEMVTQAEVIRVPRSIILGTSKVFTLQGMTRDDNPGGKEAVHIISGALAPFTGGVVIGPEVALDKFKAVFWRPDSNGPPFREVDATFPDSFPLPAGMSGIEYQLSIAKVPLFFAWKELRKSYPGAGWPPGVESKLLEDDRTIPSTIQLLRIRAGQKTPVFSIPARTHLFVLQGSVELAPAGTRGTQMNPEWHAYLPAGFSLALSNPKVYTGPEAPVNRN